MLNRGEPLDQSGRVVALVRAQGAPFTAAQFADRFQSCLPLPTGARLCKARVDRQTALDPEPKKQIKEPVYDNYNYDIKHVDLSASMTGECEVRVAGERLSSRLIGGSCLVLSPTHQLWRRSRYG